MSDDRGMAGFTILRPDEQEFAPPSWRPEEQVRTIVELPLYANMQYSRANLWRYPPGARGKRHKDLAQEEVFVVLDGTLTVDLGDPPERHEVPRGGILVAETGTILQLRNAGDEELVLFIYGAPPVTGQGEFFPSVD